MNIVERYVVWWICRQDPDELRRWAAAGEDLTPRLRREFGAQLAVGRRVIGSNAAYLAAVRGMDEVGARRLVDHLLAHAPAYGMVCFDHERWFLAQVRRARDLFVESAQLGAPA